MFRNLPCRRTWKCALWYLELTPHLPSIYAAEWPIAEAQPFPNHPPAAYDWSAPCPKFSHNARILHVLTTEYEYFFLQRLFIQIFSSIYYTARMIRLDLFHTAVVTHGQEVWLICPGPHELTLHLPVCFLLRTQFLTVLVTCWWSRWQCRMWTTCAPRLQLRLGPC